MSDRLLRLNEVAERLGYSRPSIYRHIHAGLIPAVRVGGTLRVRESDLDEYIASLPTVATA